MLGPNDNLPEEKITEEVSTTEPKTEPVSYKNIGDIEKIRLGETLGINSLEDIRGVDNDLQILWEWASVLGANNTQKVIDKINELRGHLGGNWGDKGMIKKLTRYAYLDMEQKSINKEIKGLFK